MEYLNDRIIRSVQVPSPKPDAGIYTYVVREYDDFAIEFYNIFVGNLYYNGTDTVKNIDVTDIVKNRKNIITNEVVANASNYFNQKLIKDIQVGIQWTPLTTTYSQSIGVAMVYPYVNLGELTNPSDVVFNGYTNTTHFTIANQSYRGSVHRIELTPHYPLVNTDKYNYLQTLYIGKDLQELWLYYVTDDGKGGIYESEQILYQQQYDMTTLNFKKPLGDFIKGDYASYASAVTAIRNSDVSVYQRGGDVGVATNQIKVAIIDNCPARYYLQWQDRLGGFQSQPLKDNVTYSETFSNEQVQSYTNAKRNSTVGVQPKWKLHTGWIEERIFPLYESMFVSPYLVLYDSLYDKAYDVMITGDWTEKTFKNQKKLLDITINLEANTKQNIIY